MVQKIVELHPAHVWDCEECGRENFCRGVVFEPDEEQRAQMMADGLTGDELETGYWMSAPKEVACAHCGASFDVEQPEPPE